MKNLNELHKADEDAVRNQLKSLTEELKAQKETVFNATKLFYSRYINNLVDIRTQDGDWALRGDSPFADDEILIDGNRNWYCKASNQKGDEIKFLRKEYPLLTDKGANVAFRDEILERHDWNKVNMLDSESFREELKSFREFLVNDDTAFAHKEKFLNNNFWINEAGEYHYMELSRLNAPICRYHWGESPEAFGIFFLTQGTPRIKEHPEASRIYFVENPFQKIILKDIVDDPIYVKPDGPTYFYNDYLKMVKGKEIVYVSSDLPFYCDYGYFNFDRYDGNDKDTVINLLSSYQDHLKNSMIHWYNG